MNKVIVTGSASGIGRAISLKLLADGWQVIGIDIQLQSSPTASDSFVTHQLDLCDNTATATLVKSLIVQSPITAFVHAAGFMSTQALGSLDIDASEKMWKLHVGAASTCMNILAPSLRQSAQRLGWGRVVLIGSRVAAGMPGRSQYAASKAALSSLTRSWGAELIQDAITVNTVSPAATDTPMLTAGDRANTRPKTPPIGRLIQAQEVANLVAFLLSRQADAITGQDIALCGGASLPQ